MRSTIEHLGRQLHRRWVPKWHGAFVDHAHGGFHERLDYQFQPIDVGYKRLVTQCRQIALYAHAHQSTPHTSYEHTLSQAFDFLYEKYRTKEGGWRYSCTPQGAPKDNYYDLYGHAFVIFTFVHYYNATKDPRAHALALNTLEFIDAYFKYPGHPGYGEAVDDHLDIIDKTRRQNPHMHLLEACLFAYDTWGNDTFLKHADDLVALFQKYFFDSKTKTLGEFFNIQLKKHSDDGNKVEPGHHFEWVWLLKKYMHHRPQHSAILNQICFHLLKWANTHGIDETHGGIYDCVNRTGHVLDDTKRIWPFAEAIKANALMLDHPATDRDEIKARTNKMIDVFAKSYIDKRGFWTEWLKRDLTPDTDYMPGTTPYHLYFGIMESIEVLQARGPSKSWRAKWQAALYHTRRNASDLFKTCMRPIRL